ncbi:hypothetical protein DXG03_006222 [Asterophora parasitica]|uniref:Uncharacterized protein n=1 Tax=Asterophora parasitica TaxID=117018 RepID=A0A9P7GDX2_9AGAR|nr:hypothetical protein DXG03_006222 [Asterophora parasitica]
MAPSTNEPDQSAAQHDNWGPPDEQAMGPGGAAEPANGVTLPTDDDRAIGQGGENPDYPRGSSVSAVSASEGKELSFREKQVKVLRSLPVPSRLSSGNVPLALLITTRELDMALLNSTPVKQLKKVSPNIMKAISWEAKFASSSREAVAALPSMLVIRALASNVARWDIGRGNVLTTLELCLRDARMILHCLAVFLPTSLNLPTGTCRCATTWEWEDASPIAATFAMTTHPVTSVGLHPLAEIIVTTPRPLHLPLAAAAVNTMTIDVDPLRCLTVTGILLLQTSEGAIRPLLTQLTVAMADRLLLLLPLDSMIAMSAGPSSGIPLAIHPLEVARGLPLDTVKTSTESLPTGNMTTGVALLPLLRLAMMSIVLFLLNRFHLGDTSVALKALRAPMITPIPLVRLATVMAIREALLAVLRPLVSPSAVLLLETTSLLLATAKTLNEKKELYLQ